MKFKTRKQAREYVGQLSKPSKMPGLAYGIPAATCRLGAILATVAGTVCAMCYASKGAYRFPDVVAAYRRRFATLQKPHWVAAMVKAIEGQKWFRWHDSGDIQSVGHLHNIVAVCQKSPETKFWLPTRELATLRAYMASGWIWPENLAVRLSSVRPGDGPMLTAADSVSVQCSTVDDPTSFQCPAHKQGNECGRCRACWDKTVHSVSYRGH